MNITDIQLPSYAMKCNTKDSQDVRLFKIINAPHYKERSLIYDYRIRFIQKNCMQVANIEGDAIEVGCLRGGTTKALAQFLPNKTHYAIDTFNGFPIEHLEPHEMWLGGQGNPQFWQQLYEETLEYLKDNKNVRVIRGTFPNCITPEMESTKWALVSLDTDVYESIMAGLNFFWPRLSVGGIVQIDDWTRPELAGVDRAIEEFFNKKTDNEYRAIRHKILFWGYIVKTA